MTKLVWMTDLHLVERGSDLPAGVDPLTGLRDAIEEIERFHSDAVRLVISGDLVQLHNPGAYHILREELASLSIPVRLLAGNHDDSEALVDIFPEAAQGGFVQGSEDIEVARLVYADTKASDGSHHGELCDVRIEWLAEQVDLAGGRPLLLFLHHPPFAIGVPALDRLRLRNSDGLARLLKNRRTPTHLFCGHLHRNVSGTWQGHPVQVLKSTHVQFALDMTGEKLTRSSEPPAYAVIEIRDGDIITNYRDISSKGKRTLPTVS
ncbi:phosphodiesterase [Mesorhizobium xinjiangense]|uniref:phosphodiesterase n=1 Tax=Mesorhizobium xinjiangense TaxID=2678685 RepID=UPI0012ED4472|nr:phosphodiesterase [Mesorhizobium xinjiangense]